MAHFRLIQEEIVDLDRYLEDLAWCFAARNRFPTWGPAMTSTSVALPKVSGFSIRRSISEFTAWISSPEKKAGKIRNPLSSQ